MIHDVSVHLDAADLSEAIADVTDDGRAVVHFGEEFALSLYGGTRSAPVRPAEMADHLIRLAGQLRRAAAVARADALAVDRHREANADAWARTCDDADGWPF